VLLVGTHADVLPRDHAQREQELRRVDEVLASRLK
jgi:hypothetical protein